VSFTSSKTTDNWVVTATTLRTAVLQQIAKHITALTEKLPKTQKRYQWACIHVHNIRTTNQHNQYFN